MLFRSDRKSTRLNSSHLVISYAVFCLKKKKKNRQIHPSVPHDTITHRPAHGSAPLWSLFSTRFCCVFRLLSCVASVFFFFFFNDTATTEIYTLSLHDALPI